MTKFKEQLIEWFRKKLQPIVEKKFIFKDAWQLERVTHKGVKLPYVLLENKSHLINKFWIPIRLVDIRLEVFNKNLKVGKILYDNFIKVAPRSTQNITLEVRLSHITAMFNLLRLYLIQSLTMEVKGEVHIQLFKIDFFLPVHEYIEIPKSKFHLLTEPNPLDKNISNLPFEDVTDSPVSESSIIIQQDITLDSSSDEHTP